MAKRKDNGGKSGGQKGGKKPGLVVVGGTEHAAGADRPETPPCGQDSRGPESGTELSREIRDALTHIGEAIPPIMETADAQMLTRLSDILGLAKLETERKLNSKNRPNETLAALTLICDAITPLIQTADAHGLARLGHILRMARFEMDKLLKSRGGDQA